MSETSIWTRIIVTLLFAGLYIAFVAETAALFYEFRGSGLALRLAMLDAQNFIFFPIGGLLALIAFWRPTVMLADALGRGEFRLGRLVLAGALIVLGLGAASLARSFDAPGARSIFEISPARLVADQGEPGRASVAETLIKMKILASGEEGLKPYSARCDADWLKFSTSANEEKLCLASGELMTVADCCRAKADFRAAINRMAAEAPSDLSTTHRFSLRAKAFFLLMLLGLGVFLVRYRPGLQALYGDRFEGVSFGLAAGGAIMLAWPLMNAAYIETMALLTGSGASSAYSVLAPLITLGFVIWTMLLVFFHLRSYPSQIEYAAKMGGLIGAAVGVFRYDDIISYFVKTLGAGGGVVSIVVFAVAALALIVTVIVGVRPQNIDFSGTKSEE